MIYLFLASACSSFVNALLAWRRAIVAAMASKSADVIEMRP